jgi:RimJ/RimL family protein N-acetyltransferase
MLPHMVPMLETERLILRPLELADAPQVQALFANWEVVRLLNAAVAWPYPEDGVLSHFQESALPGMARGEEWHWTLREKQSPEKVIGAIGLFRKEGNNRGFWMGLPWQGKGLMTEAVIAVTDFWFDGLGHEVLRVPKAVENTASRRISAKLGMRVVETKETDYVSGRLPTEVWEITAEEWREWREKYVAGR